MSGSLDKWRNYFRTAKGNIFDIIDHAVMVAALDCPKEFKLRRDRIAEKLFTCKVIWCLGCKREELNVPGNDSDDDEDDMIGCKIDEGGRSKENKVTSSSDDRDNNNDLHVSIDNDNQNLSNFSYGEAEALTDEIEEESQTVGEVLRIKEILDNNQDESDSVLFDCLRRLQLMALTVDALKATEIGKVVNGLRKHGSKQIRHLSRILIDGWKDLVDEWVSATKAVAEGTPDSVDPSVLDEEEGLPSPPLDDLAFFTAPSAGIELSEFFDGMDDDGNPRNSGEFIKNRENGRKPPVEQQNIVKRKQRTTDEVNLHAKESNRQQLKKQESVVKPNKPPSTNSGPGRPPKQNTAQRINSESMLHQKTDKAAIHKRQLNSQQDRFKSSDEVAVQEKLEATKRKLQESYQQAQNAKKQRTIQVMELSDLPKQGLGHRNQHARPGNNNRNWANGWR
ncbi:probable mediator of RNA polymerase II transcription subunit 26b isoform X2 [Mangifera indica]|uniref:probable mediator of RNA polymerase II transcription subunit 26b isoform X2 n=1 Tax=Mangifera indica TaxID=29780 RepID=UPI001CFB128C|nr:probable mediator of RNA polymerase II transcription subunit 26b isoform X2 [Mangifera indica]